MSLDAGQFLCNLIYFSCLLRCQREGSKSWHALFVHVPPFSAYPRERCDLTPFPRSAGYAVCWLAHLRSIQYGCSPMAMLSSWGNRLHATTERSAPGRLS